ncbi:O-antigen ligase family protein [Aestuariivivens marinum]|uniref:O-antigen ligase family protein n=1 Tax=Aestuariivivens marinum TaxID=2913555 RepID=UPI001F596FC2|nr:O-antigen ligase family protein [Aestuariivivens marinum]
MKISVGAIINVIVGFLVLIVFTNLNFILVITKGTFGILSPFIFIVTLLGLIGVLIFQKNRVGPVAQLFLFFVLVYLTSSFLSVLDFKLSLGDYVNQVSNYLKSLLIFILFYFYFRNLDLNNNLKPFFIFIAFVLFLTNSTIFFMDLYGLNVRVLYSGELIPDKWARASGVWGNANKAASYCLINIIMLMYLTLKSQMLGIKKAIIFFSIVFLLYSIYLTLSNTVLIISFFIIILYLYYFGKLIKIKTKLRIISIGLFSLLLLTIIFSKDIKEQYENLTPQKKEKIANVLSFFNIGDKKETSFSNRDKTLEIGFQKVMQNPFFGNGLGALRKKLYKEDAIHNFYIQILGEGGIISLLAYILLLLFLLLKLVSKNQFENGFLLSGFYIFLLLFGLTTHGLLLEKGYCVIFALFFVIFESKHKTLESTSSSIQ